MSSRTARADQAIRQAWENERKNVLEGKGTREWTPEQQQDILEKGKAYDDQGQTFQGQHMKSVAKYPEHQGEPENIQFLTKEEHLEAHMGSWQNPTNWYYDPVTKEYFDFGTGPYTPCKVIELKNPIVDISGKRINGTRDNSADATNDSAAREIPESNTTSPPIQSVNVKPSGAGVLSKVLNVAKEFAGQHQTFMIGMKVAGTIAGLVVADRVSGGRFTSIWNNSYDGCNPEASPSEHEGGETSDRSSPKEHIVHGHSQRYHTKNGVQRREKEPYPRGGKNKRD